MLNVVGARKIVIIKKLIPFHPRQVRTSLLMQLKLNLSQVNHMQLKLNLNLVNLRQLRQVKLQLRQVDRDLLKNKIDYS